MVAIKDMRMPSCCATCHISEVDCKYKKTAFVRCSREDFAIPSDCPLVEIITCKDCKYFERLTCLGGQCVCPTNTYINETTNDFFCKDGERRE